MVPRNDCNEGRHEGTRLTTCWMRGFQRWRKDKRTGYSSIGLFSIRVPSDHPRPLFGNNVAAPHGAVVGHPLPRPSAGAAASPVHREAEQLFPRIRDKTLSDSHQSHRCLKPLICTIPAPLPFAKPDLWWTPGAMPSHRHEKQSSPDIFPMTPILRRK